MTTNVDNILVVELDRLLNTRYPKTICPSEAARALGSDQLAANGVGHWRDLMPQIRELLWKMRSRGEVDILQRGEVIPDGTDLEDIRGPIRARRSSG